MKSFWKSILFLTILIMLIVPMGLFSQQGGITIDNLRTLVDRVDAVSSPSQDITYVNWMTISGQTGVKVSVIWQKGDNKLAKFLSPAADRNKGVLSTERDPYVAFYNINNTTGREVTLFFQEDDLADAFMDSDFTYEDMKTLKYGQDYTPVLENSGRRNDGTVQIALVPRPGVSKPYTKLELIVDPTNFQIHKINYYDEQGLLKVLERQELEQYTPSNYYVGHKLIMRNARTNHWTQIIMYPYEADSTSVAEARAANGSTYINRGIPEDLFNRQKLETDVQYIIQYIRSRVD